MEKKTAAPVAEVAAPLAPAPPDGFVKRDTIDESTEAEGEWVAAAPGLVVQGVLEKAFAMREDDGVTFRACYGIRGNDGVLRLLGEKVSFKRAIRAERLTTPVRIVFLKQVDMLNSKGVPNGKTPWRVDFAANPNAALPNSQSVTAALKDSHRAQSADGLPF